MIECGATGRLFGQPLRLHINRSPAVVLFILLSFVSREMFAQRYDSVYRQVSQKPLLWKKSVATPTLLISAGLISMTDNEVFDNDETMELRNRVAPQFRTRLDDYLQYAPIAAVYGLNAFGIKGKHDFANRTALLIKSELIMATITFPLKKFTAVPRPDTGAPTSFPSGHTAQAFAAATFLHKEYGVTHPALSFVAYGTATGIGILRVMNNRHHLSDVLVGAGIGILSTNLAYLTHQKKCSKRKSTQNSVMVTPAYSQGGYGIYLAVHLN